MYELWTINHQQREVEAVNNAVKMLIMKEKRSLAKDF